ncbi:ABC transporter permease [Myxococcota bacterium]|nr:ABC transporter permease [Myxococcota bacterium]MBU1379763.1 ABC transporter permease [Myxococcota bacterium]MBU1498524.1 ABC transporter permease [Myxococcota bacterium]
MSDKNKNTGEIKELDQKKSGSNKTMEPDKKKSAELKTTTKDARTGEVAVYRKACGFSYHFRSFLTILGKETRSFFNTPMAYIILSGFVLLTSWLFFETFWLRNEASARPLFDALPKIFLIITPLVTMKMWAEEYSTGTHDQLMSLPVNPAITVMGKITACLSIILMALILTLPYPIVASVYGNLDWGPVWGGYLGALLLGLAYASVGLFISSLTRTQVEAAFVTLFVAGFFYFIGESNVLENFSSSNTTYILGQIGLGSRFRNISRGVLDIRDLVYYASFSALFIVVNVAVLRHRKWM